METLSEARSCTGMWKNVTDYGAFVALAESTAAALTDLSWGRVKHPSDVVSRSRNSTSSF